jgi:hypothetical protein
MRLIFPITCVVVLVSSSVQFIFYNYMSVHCAGLLDVQNILSADTVVSPGKLKVIHSVIT